LNRTACRKIAIILIAVSAILGLSGCASDKDKFKNMSAQEMYDKGQAAAKKKNFRQAIEYYDALEAHYPYGEYTDKAQLALIHAYANGNEEASALATADRFIRMHPRHPHVDFAYYMKGVINYEENYSIAFKILPIDRSLRSSEFAQHAFDDFKTFLEKFPNSKYACDAEKRMIVLREQLADHNLSIAKYYQGQGADLAAANRAGYVVNQFPQTKAAPKALLLMYDSYNAMGMKQEANEAMKTMAKNFPKYHEENPVPTAMPDS